MCAGLARADVFPHPTHPEASGSSLAGGGEAQGAACSGSKVAIPAILSRFPDPVLAVRLQDCKVSTFGRALHHLDQAQAARAGQPRGMIGSFLRSQSCDIPRMAVFCRKSAILCSILDPKVESFGLALRS